MRVCMVRSGVVVVRVSGSGDGCSEGVLGQGSRVVVLCSM